MRTQGSISCLAGVMLALMSGCSPDEPEVVAVEPEPPAPEPELAPEPRVEAGPNQVVINAVRPTQGASQTELSGVAVDRAARSGPPPAVIPQIPRRLVFECTDGVMFAVRILDNRLHLYPPRMPAAGFLALPQVPSASGVHYRAGDVDFRSKGDLATLEMGR
jgi:membrane-bound inhibitor of C-type lysozyme